MKPFMGEDFLLGSELARRLYHDHAAPLPIIDYHCHLPPQEIAEDRRFDNIAQIWLEGDHYKWRALRTAGVAEQLITGDASDRDKYQAWANTVPKCLGNPLYTWTHLELQRPFGLNAVFGPDTADDVWRCTREQLSQPEFSARGIMQQMNVAMVGTTDDPADDLRHHAALQSEGFGIKVLPSFRPDRAFKIELPGFAQYMQTLGEAADVAIDGFESLRTALVRRLNHFGAYGCNIADHGIEVVRYAPVPDDATLTAILHKRLAGQTLDALEISQFSTAVQTFLGCEYARRGWVMQMHIGAQRDNNTRMLERLGANTGFDSIGDQPLAQPLAQLLDTMDQSDELPKTILYCINPRDNEVFATMIGNFQDGSTAGKVQFGSGWWFNDQKDGMQRQLMQLSQLGLLNQFVGMLTDSRSFLSYTRHEYFRRILCEMVAGWVINGEAPNDPEWLGAVIEDVCFHNANRYFELDLPTPVL